ncbi:hypothetical protein PT974_02369 [Cladobotryum mycophilum]|uniref:Heterokaryon incompatibility domain-containing protein n=1 Tax=Cladobotryum mycophilum TaxID=491253 RepID=A0ABR0SZ34_9HYPO
MAPYPYQPLNLPGETRILIISPGKYEDDLVCSLSHMPLSSGTESYEALSYCWSKSVTVDKEPDYSTLVSFAIYGDGVNESKEVEFRELLNSPYTEPHYIQQGGVLPAGTILCDGVEMTVGGELYRALKRLRGEDKSLRMWVDALCINQNDIGERNEHVKIMGLVYAGAECVRIWLGERIGIEFEATSTLEGAVDILNDAFQQLQSADFTPLDMELLIKRDKRSADLAWESLDAFFHRAWFQRIWVIQEVVNARNATVHVGDLTMDWGWLSRIVTAARVYKMDRIFTSYSVNAISIMSTLNQQKQENQRISLTLLDTLEETRRFQSTFASDKIYGIMGMVEDAQDVVVDYSIAGHEVFKRLAVDLLAKGKSLDILYHCVHPQAPSALKLPSWVADWTAPGFVEPLKSRRLVAKAAGDTEARLTIDGNEEILSIWGKEIDKIVAVDEVKIIASSQTPDSIGSWYAANAVTDENSIEKSVNDAVNSNHRNLARNRHHRTSVKKSLENIIAMASPESPLTLATTKTLARTFMCNSTPEGQRPDDFCLSLGWDVFYHYNLLELSPEAAHKAAADNWIDRYYDIDNESLEKYYGNIQRAFAEFTRSYGRWPYNRRFFKTASGHFGWAVNGVQPGDVVSVLFGGSYPFVLREQADGKYKIMGDCYLDGFMDGEGMADTSPEKVFHVV